MITITIILIEREDSIHADITGEGEATGAEVDLAERLRLAINEVFSPEGGECISKIS